MASHFKGVAKNCIAYRHWKVETRHSAATPQRKRERERERKREREKGDRKIGREKARIRKRKEK